MVVEDTINRYKKFSVVGNKNGRWKGGKIVSWGYIYIYKPDHPIATITNPYVAEHVLVMEAHLGRYLTKGEIVHHKDENKQNNSIDNLVILDNSNHAKHHFTDKHPNLGKHIDTSNRICFKCNSNKTKINQPNTKTGNKTPCPEWHHLPTDKQNWYCHKCYRNYMRK